MLISINFYFSSSRKHEAIVLVLFVRGIYDSAALQNSVDSMVSWRMRQLKQALQGVVSRILLLKFKKMLSQNWLS